MTTAMKVDVTERDVYEGARNLEILRAIVTGHQHSKIRIAGKTSSVDAQTANVLVTVHDALGAKNKVSFVALLAHSPATFRKLVDFAWAHTS